MSSPAQKSIEWPDETNILKASRKDYTFAFIQGVFYNTGVVVSTIYLLIKLILQPSLDAHYSQRRELSAATLLHLRKLVTTLQNKLVYTPISAIGYDGVNGQVERSIQASEDNYHQPSRREVRLKRLNGGLKEAVGHLQRYNTTAFASSKNMDSFHFQMKLLVDEIKLNKDSEKASEYCTKIVDSVRAVKGWFVNGRFP